MSINLSERYSAGRTRLGTLRWRRVLYTFKMQQPTCKMLAEPPSRQDFERNATAKRYNSMAESMRTLKLPNSGNDEPKEGEVVNQPSHTQQTYTVKIRCNDTGEVVNYHVSQEWDDEITLFLWTEGNWSCDCNRQRFFFLAKGIDAPTNITCSDGKYTVIKSMLPDGRTIKID